jgi:plasmid stability protein
MPSLILMISYRWKRPISSITIRNLDSKIKERLRVRVAEHDHSMEAEARRILQTALTEPALPSGRNLYERVRVRFTRLGVLTLSCRIASPRANCRVRLMFVLDTNIQSAMMSIRVVPEVAEWIAGQPVDLLLSVVRRGTGISIRDD